MKKEDLIHKEVGSRDIALRFVEKRKKWEEEQLKQGKKEVRIPHPTVEKTFIIKFI
jgi:hypothetical protein